MDEDNRKDLSQLDETTPLLSKKDAALTYSKIEATKCASDAEPANGQVLATAGTSSINDDYEASPSAAEAELSKKRREEELAEHISSYEGMADVVTPSYGCGLCYGIWLFTCFCLASFVIQLALHIALLPIPVSIGFMGADYLSQCSMDSKLPYAMIVVGCIGTLVLLVRIALLLHTKFSNDERLKRWIQKADKILECAFLISWIVEFCFSYNKSPSNDLFSANYCEERFYSFISSMNNVLIAIVVVWIFLYFVTRQRCMGRVAPP